MSTLNCTKLTIFTIAGVIIQIIGLSIFVFAFFPVKPALSGVSGPESFRSPSFDSVQNYSYEDLPPDNLRLLYQELSGISPSYDKLILMVIDGLPAEFVLGKDGKPPRTEVMEAMPYTQSLLESGMAIGFHAKAAPPTVTMPRLKAMVSGAIGGFLDVAFNFNTQALLDDNLLGQFFRIGWRMVMLGDETWLKLFPGLFMRDDGVSSFFVKDTVTIDHNVSRHLPDELSSYDWNLLILHYLGLDHVGHIGGRNSILMAPKLKEMDEVVRMIHTSRITSQRNNHGKTLLVVVSDHGMTENGNHGGSSYEETDSLALFIGLENGVPGYSVENTVYQVDIAPTLALLFGVPIPKNNVGIQISKVFDHLADEQKLRALELNSGQLLRLMQAQMPGLLCGSFPHSGLNEEVSGVSDCNGSMEKIFCCLYRNALFLHNSWLSKDETKFKHGQEHKRAIEAYKEFLRVASEWLSRRVTDKPVGVLAFGVAAMLVSCVILLKLLCLVSNEVNGKIKNDHFTLVNSTKTTWNLDEAFTIGVIFIVVISMGSSSMVEEEQYIWHFATSTLSLLLLRKTLQSLQVGKAHNLFSFFEGQNKTSGLQTSWIVLLLVSGRILRGWHQGGVNWTNLPDISKWLDQAGSGYIKLTQLVAGILVITLSLISFSTLQLNKFGRVIELFILTPGLLVLQHITKRHDIILAPSSYSSTTLEQTIYMILGFATLGIVVSIPWILPLLTSKACSLDNSYTSSSDCKEKNKYWLVELRNSLAVIGWAYICAWCLLQLLLQQPINSMPILLRLLQVLVTIFYARNSGPHQKQWVEVALFYYMGMVGHYALGNSNSLATIDVAGAFIGISSHSTVLSGILMFIITYASPMFALLSMVMYTSVLSSKYLELPSNMDSGQFLKTMLSFPCLLPLSLNSVLLVAYTIVLILMRNHLFVWSVFSPKYLYVCAATVCVYVGVSVVAATVIYIYWAVKFRRTQWNSAITNEDM